MSKISTLPLDILLVSSSTLRGLFAAGIGFNVAQQEKKSGGETQ
jgi:hypothetical protein